MQESPIFSRTYDLLLWLLPQATKFPRIHRFGLGERIVNQALEFQEILIRAGLSRKERGSLLNDADVQLALLRQNLRLCKDLDLLKVSQYEHVASMLAEIGRLLGGWKKLNSVNHRFVILRSQRSSGDEESPVICAQTLRSQRTLAQSDMKS